MLQKHLAAGATRKDGAYLLRDHREPSRSGGAPRERAEERAPLGADREPEGDALDIHAGMEAARGVLQHGGHAKPRLRREGTAEKRAGLQEEGSSPPGSGHAIDPGPAGRRARGA